MAKLLQGIIPALVTPFLPEGGVDVAAVHELVKFHLGSGISGFYVCGNTGEGFYASVDERKLMASTVVSAVDNQLASAAAGTKRPTVTVMVAAAAVTDAVELAKHAASIGADAISSVVPLDRPNNLAAAVEYWKTISSATALPFYVYWIASTADKATTAEQFLSAMRDVPNFCGFKFTDTNFFMFQQLMCLGRDQQINGLTGPDEMMAAGLMMGSDGAIGSTYNIHPRLAVRIYNAFRAGRLEEARQGQEDMNRIIAVLLKHCRCREKGTNIVAGIKCIYRRKYGINAGVTKPGASIVLSEEEQEALMKALEGMRFD